MVFLFFFAFQDSDNYGKSLSNAIYHLDANHTMLSTAIKMHGKVFDRKWASGGSILMTRFFIDINLPRITA